MKRFVVVYFCFFFVTIAGSTHALGGNSWVTKASLSEPKREIMSSEFNGKIYVFGGYYPDHRKNTVEEYDPIADTWTTKASMPTARDGGISTVVNGKIYVIGGITGGSPGGTSILNTVEEYDPVADSWTNCGTGCAPMLTARTRFTGAAVNGKIYAIGGEPNSTDYNIVEEYDPATNTWTTKTSMPTPRTSLTSSVVNGKIYVIGGFGLGTVEEYDPATDTWTNCGNPAPGNACVPMPTGRSALTSSVVNGKIYAIGGSISGASFYLDTVEEYDPATNTWTTKTPMPTARKWPTSSVANGKIYAIGGQAYEVILLSTVEEYTPPKVPEVSKEIIGVDRIEATPIFDVFVGDMFTYTIEIKNPFEQAVYFMVSDTLDVSLKYVLNSFRINDTPAGNGAFATGDSLYTDHLLGVGSLLSLAFKVEVLDVPAGSMIDNIAWITTYTNPLDVSGTTLAMVEASAPQAQVHAIPEPATLLLFGIGLGGIVVLIRRIYK